MEQILRQPDFVASPRLSSFLRFVVTETLDGRADRLKAFTVASMALGHNEKFDPRTNSAVRVHAGRLRRLLEHYYNGAGRLDTCEIRLPRGSYVPEFLFRTEEVQIAPASAPLLSIRQEPAGEPLLSDPLGMAQRQVRRLLKNPAIVAIAVLLGLCAGLWRAGLPIAFHADGPSAPPSESRWAGAGATITVDPIEGLGDDATVSTFSDLLQKRLEDALSGFDSPLVLHRIAATTPPARLDYHLSGRVTQAAGGDASLSFRIWRPVSGEIIWTRTFDGLRLAKTSASLEPTIDALTSDVAQTYGVLFTDMRRQLSSEPDGFGCVILASDYFKSPSPAAHAAARDCLERTVAQHPTFAPGFAALTYLMVDTYLNGVDARPSEKPLDLAIQMAHRAVDLAPEKARSHAALFVTRFFDKRFDDAFDSAGQAMELNPYATDTAARIGAAYVLRGEFDKGMTFLQRAARFSPSPPGWYEFYFFLDAHTRGDDHAARRHAMRRSATRFPLGILARIIVAHQQGDTVAVAHWTQQIFADYPTIADDVPAALERYAMAPDISRNFLADLRDAGFPTIAHKTSVSSVQP